MIRTCNIAALGGIAMFACVPEFVQTQGERVLYEHSASLRPCAGNAPFLDGLVPFLEQQLALEAPDRLRFSWIDPSDAWLSLGTRAVGNHAWATDPVHVHEFAHAVTGSMPAMFFTEGLASAVDQLDAAPKPRYPWSDDQLAQPAWDPRATMTATSSDGVNYDAASAFVSFLIVRHGAERFHDFYRGLGGPPTMPWLRGQFRRVYGFELDDAIDAFRAGIPPCEADAYRLAQPECSAPRVTWTSDRQWEHPVSMACDDPGVVGGSSPDWAWPSFYAVTIDVTVRGYHVLNIDNLDVTVRFGPCFGCPWDPPDVFLDSVTPQRTMLLDPGTYYLRVNSNSDEAPEVTVRLERF